MLYAVHEAQRLLLRPLVSAARLSQRAVDVAAPLGPWPFPQLTSASLALFDRVARRYDKPTFGIDAVRVGEIEVPVRERVVLRRPFCDLVAFERDLPAGAPRGPGVLVFAPLSGHHATLLRETVRTMLPHHDVWITDWRDARLVPRREGVFTLDGYVQYAIDFMRHLGAETHVVAVCQPSVPVLAAVSAMSTLGDPAVPRSLTLMGGPVDPRRNPTEVNRLATARPLSWFEHSLVHRVPPGYPGVGRRVYPGFLQHLAFVSMNPDRHFDAHVKYFFDRVHGHADAVDAHQRFYDEYNAVLDMDAPYYLETVRTVFQEFALPRGTWDVRLADRTVRVAPGDVRRPALLTVEGELDDISGVGQTAAAHDLCAGIPDARRRHHVERGAGHYGIFSGRRWRESIYPVLRAHIADA